ncbi:MAG: secondary thiamine-phosphate synthase enzyme YjbQ [Candidatus Paceibacterota bacterium]|jgi:secondary thiamine-phosphate synthase enzyme
MKTFTFEISVKTREYLDIQDLTDQIAQQSLNSKIKDGLINIQTLHTTTAIILNENEPLLLQDFKNNLERTAPKDIQYKHDDFSQRTVNMCDDECQNGHSHCKALHLSSNICINLIDSKLQLGTWQRILFIELDRPRTRKIQIQIIGQ